MTQLDDLLAATRRRYAASRPRSAAMHDQARAVMPGGNTRSVLHFDPFPFRVDTAQGAELVDVDGHRLIDLLGNYTAGLLGHSPVAVRDALIARLDRGWAIGATHPDEIELAALLCDRFASLEQVRFTNSGTEANLMAIGVAVHHVGRSGVLAFEGGYHGGVLSFGHGPGPLNVPHPTTVVPFGDLDGAAAVLATGAVGCVIVEPVQGSAGCIVAPDGFLAGLRRLCDSHGVVLIFDEVMTSRLHPGGAQALFGVRPDMTTLGKYLAGGMSFGAFGGRAEIMCAFDPECGGTLTQAGTFNNNVLSMAAGIVTLRDVLTDDVLHAVNRRGDELRHALGALFTSSAIPLATRGVGSMIGIHGTADGAERDQWLELFFFGMLERGVYVARRGFMALSIEIGDEHVDHVLAAAQAWATSVGHFSC